MSRRQSRVSIDSRQNDTLLEFENFKKKFLLANKHITKLNSTLSARIEELNAQISTLYVENLRLRASEIALASQLKREREKSRKILADAETATHSLIKHLGHIRKSFNVTQERAPTPESPPPPRARRPIPDPNASPPINRLARAPTVPGIYEDDEHDISTPEDPEVYREEELSPSRRRKAKPRTSSSRLPIPGHTLHPEEHLQVDLSEQLGKSGKRKPARRQSGLLATMAIATVTSDGIAAEVVPPRPLSPALGSPLRREMELAEEVDDDGAEEDVEVILQSVTRRERKEKRVKDSIADVTRTKERERRKPREPEFDPADFTQSLGSTKSRLKDVTNSQASRPVLPLIDTASDRERQHTPERDVPTSATSSYAASSTRAFLSTPATTPAPTPLPEITSRTSHISGPRASSPVSSVVQADEEAAGGRERRVRKSINYAEPKLNTKMRKPDPPPSITTSKRKSTSSSDLVPSRGGSSDPSSHSQPSTSRSNSPEPSPHGVKRKKSRVYVLDEDGEESEGAQADAEYGGLRGGSSWVNFDGRRRSVHGANVRRTEGDDARRHSMAV